MLLFGIALSTSIYFHANSSIAFLSMLLFPGPLPPEQQSQATTRGGGLRRAPKRGHRSISILTPFVAYQTYLALECISVFALHPTPLY